MKRIQKKRKNEGFSLVELIVVVLIMAIIAATLTPQVIKWVNNSRKSADADTYESLISGIQIALADEVVFNECKTLDITVNLNAAADAESKKYVIFTVKDSGSCPQLISKLQGLLGEGFETTIKAKVSGAAYSIGIKNGVVSRGTGTGAQPDADNMD